MKVIKPFFLGILGGLALALALVAGLYFSPLREAAYVSADPEMASIRTKLARYQEWLSQTDLRLAQDGDRISDSLRTAQTKAWRDYKGWRTRLGELARAHKDPTAAGLWPWAYSLRFWILPIAALFALIPGTAAAWRAWYRFRPGRRPKPAPNSARAQALSSFEDAVKKVARISKADRAESTSTPVPPPMPRKPGNLPTPEKPRREEPRRDEPRRDEPPTEYLNAYGALGTGRVHEDSKPGNTREPETKPLPLPDFNSPPPDGGRDTRYMHIGPTWGEPLDLSGAAPPGKPPLSAAGPSGGRGLAMEDEDSGIADAQAGESGESGEETLGVMPPTTEVERVERRKDEVLKLARKGMTSSEISRRLRISQDQVEFIIRLRREKG